MTSQDGWAKIYSFTTAEKSYPQDYAESLLVPYKIFSKRLRIVTFSGHYVTALMYDAEKSDQIQVKQLFADHKTVRNVSKEEAMQVAIKLLPEFGVEEISRAFDNWMYYRQT